LPALCLQLHLRLWAVAGGKLVHARVQRFLGIGVCCLNGLFESSRSVGTHLNLTPFSFNPFSLVFFFSRNLLDAHD
jgi:hypothetical protein